ncbi:MAG: Abi family protein [Eggerthellaceae bacterium]|nr:Abi family protein [Eggerthellaceae bacterium]
MENEPTTQQPEPYIDAQIAKLKKQGVTFDICTESEAREYMADKCEPHKVSAYARLFDVHDKGEQKDKYVALDFSQLKYLADLDQRLREILLVMTLDIEHFCKTRLLTECAVTEGDGHSIVSGYMDGLDKKRQKYVMSELARHEHESTYQDANPDQMPLWAFLQMVSFGTLLGVIYYCAEQHIGENSVADYSVLHAIKSLRNTCAHGSWVLLDLSPSANGERIAPHEVSDAVAAIGISKRARRRWLQTVPVSQIASLLYLYSQVVPNGSTKTRRLDDLQQFFAVAEKDSVLLEDNPAQAAISFIKRLTEGFGLIE